MREMEGGAEQFIDAMLDSTSVRTLHGLFVTSHGTANGLSSSNGRAVDAARIDSMASVWYRYALVIVNACFGRAASEKWVAKNGVLLASDGILVPPFGTHSPRSIGFPPSGAGR